jgi:hypothetical protein
VSTASRVDIRAQNLASAFPLADDPRTAREAPLRKILLLAAGAVFAAGLGGHAAKAELQVQLSPKDPKYNSRACVNARVKLKNYKNGLFEQDAGTYIIAGVMPGGTVGFLALQARKDEYVRRDVEQACMSNPPDRSYLDKTIGR